MIKGISRLMTSFKSFNSKGLQHIKTFSNPPFFLSSFKSNSFLKYNSISLFSTNQNPEEPKSSSKNKIEKEIFTENHLSGMSLEEFVAFINNKDKKFSDNYNYGTKTIYALSTGLKNKPQIGKITFDKAFWKTIYIMEALIWGPLFYIIYAKISPLASILPLLGFTATAAATRISQLLIENSVMRMDLLNSNQVMIYPWGTQGIGITCKIEGAKLIDAKLPVKKEAKSKEIDDEESRESVSIEAVFIEDTPKQKKIRAVFLVSPEASPIENVDLFKNIIYGNVNEVEKFELKEPIKQDKVEEENKDK